jgi:hypothetical protein
LATLKRYENYPLNVVILSNLVSIGIYGSGFLILYKLGNIFAILYLFYVLIFEVRLIKNHCTNCFYWGKTCGFGKGRLSAWFFKRKDITKFCVREMTWRDLIPDILISLIPLIAGIVLLILKFDYLLLLALLLLILLTTTGNGYIRRQLTCKYCKQRDIGCPANDLFNKRKE